MLENVMDNKELEHALRDALERERAEIQTLSAASNSDRAPVSLDQQSVGRLSRMDAMQMQAMAQAGERRRQQRVGMIAAALQRMDEGEYGYCLGCGDPIAEGRLRADPTSVRCVACAASA
jgi:DnaK suppressor protein